MNNYPFSSPWNTPSSTKLPSTSPSFIPSSRTSTTPSNSPLVGLTNKSIHPSSISFTKHLSINPSIIGPPTSTPAKGLPITSAKSYLETSIFYLMTWFYYIMSLPFLPSVLLVWLMQVLQGAAECCSTTLPRPPPKPDPGDYLSTQFTPTSRHNCNVTAEVSEGVVAWDSEGATVIISFCIFPLFVPILQISFLFCVQSKRIDLSIQCTLLERECWSDIYGKRGSICSVYTKDVQTVLSLKCCLSVTQICQSPTATRAQRIPKPRLCMTTSGRKCRLSLLFVGFPDWQSDIL